MLTQCPHCLTLFRVGPEHLKAAAGQVRCCRCHQVFNALQRLQDSPTSFTNPSDSTAPLDEGATLADDGLETATEPSAERQPEGGEIEVSSNLPEQVGFQEFQPVLSEFDSPEKHGDLLDDILERDDGLDPEPDYLTDGSESQMSELLDQDSSSILLPDSEAPEREPLNPDDNVVTFSSAVEPHDSMESIFADPEFSDSILKDETADEEAGKSDYDSMPAFRRYAESTQLPLADDEQTFNFEAVKPHRRRGKSGLLWFIGSLLLLIPLGGQLAWQYREELIQYDMGRQTLSLLCRIADCKVPVRRALDKIAIQGRNLSTHPEKPNTLFLQVNIVNTAGFEQPFPKLALSLYNDKGTLIARRTFLAKDYLPAEFTQRNMMPVAEPILVEMELVDPGKEVTGFSFDFF